MEPELVERARALLDGVVRPAIHPRRTPLGVTARHLPGEPLPVGEAATGDFEPFEVGQQWGGMWSTTWFRMTATIPVEWAGETVVALVHLGGARTVGFSAEGLVHDGVTQRVIQGLHHRHREVRLFERAVPQAPVDLLVEAAANPIPRWHMADWPLLEPDYEGPPLYTLEQAELATLDVSMEALASDLRVAIQLARAMPDSVAAVALSKALDAMRDGCPADEVGVIAREAKAAETRAHRVHAVGHAHIDTAWLWPVRETRRKCARTFANQLRLMERYPEHRFACSQAAQYEWIKCDHPELWQEIAERVKEGRWLPVGGMWVEPDTNIPSGESLIRQFLHGKRFFAEQFAVETAEVWIPDVFGYTAALPQIAAGCGATSLITQKLSWNDTNRFPHTTFWWEGHDGTRILAHFPPADTYNGTFAVEELLTDRRNHRDAGVSPESLYLYGYGDGGGGPTAGMLEQYRRLRGMGVSIGTVQEFLRAVPAERLESWIGELYLEAHRATYTTHADVKEGNRRGEEALRAAEMWSVGAGIDNSVELDRLWKLLLVNQFHDILPGSSIHWVYENCNRDHAEITRNCGSIIDAAQEVLVGAADEPVVFNPSSYSRREVVDLGDGPAMIEVPGCGWAPAVPLETPDKVTLGHGFMDNGLLRVVWDGSGLLVSVWDHEAQREVLAQGERGNMFQIHDDHPRAFDAWDVDREYLLSCDDLDDLDIEQVVESHPLRAGVRFTRRFGSSRITQVMRLAAESRRIEFDTELDWQERHRFLKVAFPVAIRSTRATYEIQHGHIERPTTANTSWEQARFEVCAHRWAHVGEPGYGVALINDCKYGYDIRNHTMRLSLLRGPGYPDPEADRGRHRFRYALLPHPGDLRWDGRVPEEAEAFNLPLTIRPGRSGNSGRLVSVDQPGVSVEAFKKAEDGRGVVLRLCEVYGARRTARVRISHPWVSVERTDLLERSAGEAVTEGDTVVVALRPFELVTLRFA